MNSFPDERCISNWNRGDIRGEWMLSHSDFKYMFLPDYDALTVQEKEQLYAGSNYLLPHMASMDALMYNVQYRNYQETKMRSLPWNVNLMNAFHNLHFILYMADRMPDFNTKIDDGQRTYMMDIPGRPIWIFQLIMKAATDCLRDKFVKLSETCGDDSKYRCTPMATDNDDALGFQLHITGDCVFNIWVDFKPCVNEDGTFGFKHKVSISCSTWHYGRVPLTGKGASKSPLRKCMLNMRSYIDYALVQFAKALRKAEFNRPENSLFLLNTGH